MGNARLLDVVVGEVRLCLAPLRDDAGTRRLGVVVMAIAVALVALHGVALLLMRHEVGLPSSRAWLRLDADRSLSEQFEYVCTLAAAWFVAAGWRESRQPVYLVLVGLLLLMFLDNAFRLHGDLAILMVEDGWMPRLVGDDEARGELLFFAAAGLLMLIAFAVAFVASDLRHRVRTLILLVPIVGAAVCGVAIDFVGHVGDFASPYSHLIGVIEDGGELVMIAILLILAHAHSRTIGRTGKARLARRCSSAGLT